MTPARQGAAEPAERAQLPPTPWAASEPAPESFPGALWLAARGARSAWKVRGTVFCDETFVTDGAMILRRDLVWGPLPDWLEHSPGHGIADGPKRREMLEGHWRKAVEAVDTVLRHPRMGTPVAGGPTVRYQLEDEREVYLSGGRLWLARGATRADQLWVSSDDPGGPVVAGRGRDPTALIMPLTPSSCEAFEPWEEA